MTKGTLNCFKNVDRTPAQVSPVVTTSIDSYAELEALEGIHVVDGTYIKLQHNLARNSHYAKVWNGREWVYDGKRLLGKLSEATRLNREQAKAWGDLYGTCCHCGRELTDEESVTNSLGRICAKKYWWTT